ncbi:hypothetical protein HYW58_02470 [Candidatus Kaiserbacteria bacterium]|nr:hypothetical protein [Candidatus Kaiserbacteria bacterium]
MNELNALFANTFLTGTALIVILVLVIWTTVWKGLALWRAARLGAKWWFIALLIINTAGILEILYLFVFSKKKSGAPETQLETKVS